MKHIRRQRAAKCFFCKKNRHIAITFHLLENCPEVCQKCLFYTLCNYAAISWIDPPLPDWIEPLREYYDKLESPSGTADGVLPKQ